MAYDLMNLMQAIRMQSTPDRFGSNFHAKRQRAYRRKRNRRLRAANGGKMPKQFN